MEKSTYSPQTFLMFQLILQTIMYLLILLDIPFLRQAYGFVFFLFVPGFIILKLLGLDKVNKIESVLLSVGISISILMLLGTTINLLGLFGWVQRPLSSGPIIIVVSVSITIMSILSYLKKTTCKVFKIGTLNIWILLACIILPISSMIGVLFIRYFNSNAILIAVMLSIPAILAFTVFHSKFSSKFSSYYPLILMSVVLAVILSAALTSNYLYGDDIQAEFDTFSKTETMEIWNPENVSYAQQSSDNSMMSVTILPVVLANLLNIEPTWLFKIVFPLIFSLVPLGLYQLYQEKWSRKVALTSIFFFVANYVFFAVVLTNAKQMIGEMFFVLLFVILFSKNIKQTGSSWVIFVLALFGLIVSHYSMNYVFLLLIFFTWLGTKVLRIRMTKITSSIIAFCFSLSFFWYIYIIQAQGPFRKFYGVIETTISSFIAEFFSTAARGEDIQAALGLVARPSELHFIGTLLYEITILLIFIGFISLFLKWRKKEFDGEFLLLTGLSFGLLVSAIVVPRFAGFLELGRLYHILLIFLSPLFVLGSQAIVNGLSKLKKVKIPTLSFEKKKRTGGLILSVVILTFFFLFQSGVVYEVADDPFPSSIVLSKYKMDNSSGLIHESDVFSAEWLSNYGKIDEIWTFSDSMSLGHVLTSYSAISRDMVIILTNTTERVIVDGTFVSHNNSFVITENRTYIYRSQFTMTEGKFPYDIRRNIYFDYEEIPVFNTTNAFVNKIYSNGYSEIYFRIPD